MALTKVALHCLDSSSYFKHDILFMREGVQNFFRERHKYGEFHTSYKKYRNNSSKFYEYTRMNVETFDYILQHIEKFPQQLITTSRTVTDPEKLFLTLRYIAHGMSIGSLSKTYRLGRSTVYQIIYDTLKAIWIALAKLHIPQPTQEDFKNITKDFYSKWQFPNCIGALGDTHFRTLRRQQTGRTNKSSLVLQGISDPDYKFIAIEVNDNEESDGGTFNFSKLSTLLFNNKFNIPPSKELPGSNMTLPHVLVGNEGYPLKTYLMRPYPSNRHLTEEKTLFNDRLSRARLTIDCVFGIITNKWRILKKTMDRSTNRAKLIIKVACLLHNIVRQRVGNKDKDFREFSNNLTNCKKKIGSKRNNRSTGRAIAIREQYRKYFVEQNIN